MTALAEHVNNWGDLIEIELNPIVEDAQAAEAAAVAQALPLGRAHLGEGLAAPERPVVGIGRRWWQGQGADVSDGTLRAVLCGGFAGGAAGRDAAPPTKARGPERKC